MWQKHRILDCDKYAFHVENNKIGQAGIFIYDQQIKSVMKNMFAMKEADENYTQFKFVLKLSVLFFRISITKSNTFG